MNAWALARYNALLLSDPPASTLAYINYFEEAICGLLAAIHGCDDGTLVRPSELYATYRTESTEEPFGAPQKRKDECAMYQTAFAEAKARAAHTQTCRTPLSSPPEDQLSEAMLSLILETRNRSIAQAEMREEEEEDTSSVTAVDGTEERERSMALTLESRLQTTTTTKPPS